MRRARRQVHEEIEDKMAPGATLVKSIMEMVEENHMEVGAPTRVLSVEDTEDSRQSAVVDTSGTIKKARVDGPCCCVTAFMFAIAVGVEPREMPPNPAQITVAS